MPQVYEPNYIDISKPINQPLTSDNITLLLIGIIFTLLGIVASHFYQWKRVKTYIPLLIGLGAIYLTTLGPLSHSRSKIDAIIHLDDRKVIAFYLQPTHISSYKAISLVSDEMRISDLKTIRHFCLLLQQASPTDEGYLKNPTQAGRVEISFRDGSNLVLGLKKDGSATCLLINSNGEDGWHYANLEATGLGALIDSLLTNRLPEKLPGTQ